MKGEFSRATFTKEAHYRTVTMQQGRVQLDADWNEGMDLQVRDNQVYLEVWQRDVEPAEDDSISHPNHDGPDTGKREPGSEEQEPILRVRRQVHGKHTASSIIEAVLGTVHGNGGESFLLPALEITIAGVRWERTTSFSPSGPRDRVYIVREKDGRSAIEFGDGKNGARPPAGSQIVASYRVGIGSAGIVGG